LFVHAFENYLFIHNNIVLLHVLEAGTFLIKTASFIFPFVLEERVSELIEVLDAWEELIDQAETHIHLVNREEVEKIWECKDTNLLRDNYSKVANGKINTLI